MKKTSVLFFALFGIVLQSHTQNYIEPLVGFSKDQNNKTAHFSTILTGVQWHQQTRSGTGWLLRFEKGWGLAEKSLDSSFTPDPTLPVYQPAEKSIRPALFQFSTGLRLQAFKLNKSSNILVLMYAGLSWQKFNVSYTYNKNQYTVLNPDRSLAINGIFVSGGVEYMRRLKHGRIFFDALISSPPARRKFSYPASFKFIAPLSFNAGFSIPVGKKLAK